MKHIYFLIYVGFWYHSSGFWTAVLYEWIFWLNELTVTDQLNLILHTPVLVFVVNIWSGFPCISQKGSCPNVSLFSDSYRTEIYSVCSCDLETVYFWLLWCSVLVDVTGRGTCWNFFHKNLLLPSLRCLPTLDISDFCHKAPTAEEYN